MTNGYILEIKTSTSSSNIGSTIDSYNNNNNNNKHNKSCYIKNNVGPNNEVGNNDDNNNNLKEQFKTISNQDNDLTLSMDNKIKNNKKLRNNKRHHRKNSSTSSSHSLDKYIKFTVKRSNYHKGEEIFNRISKFMIIFLSIAVIRHVLSKVDPIGKCIGGEIKLKEINEFIIKKYYKIIKNEDNLKSIEKIRYNNYNSILIIIDKIISGLGINREENLIKDLISLIYFGISVYIINEIYWRVYHEIEESLIIIPHLGVQTESILIKENIWQVLKNILGLDKIFNNNNSNNSNNGNTIVRNEDTNKNKEGIIINKQFICMDYVKDIVINEGFKGFEVIFYMTLIMEEGVIINKEGDKFDNKKKHLNNDINSSNNDYDDVDYNYNDENNNNTNNSSRKPKLKMIVVFPNLLPRRAILETVFRKSREYLKK